MRSRCSGPTGGRGTAPLRPTDGSLPRHLLRAGEWMGQADPRRRPQPPIAYSQRMEASIKGAIVVEVLRGRSELPRRLDKASLLMEAIWEWQGCKYARRLSPQRKAYSRGTCTLLLRCWQGSS